MADRKITELSAMSAGGQATGDLVTVVDVSEAAAADKNKKMTMENLFKGIPGDVGIGTASPAGNLQILGGGDRSLLITGGTSGTTSLQMGDSDDADVGAILYDNSNNSMQFKTNASEAARVDNSGRLLVGTPTSTAASGQNNRLQLFGTTQASGRMSIIRSSDDNGGSGIHLCKSRGTAGDVVVNNGDQVGIIAFNPYDGGDFQRQCANIQGEIDGTPGTDDVPGRITFSTTADGASTPTERMRIDSSGSVGVGLTSLSTTGFGRVLRVKAATGAAGFFVEEGATSTWLGLYGGTGTSDSAALLYPSTGSFRIGTTTAVGTTGFSEKLRIDSSGRLLVGTSATPPAIETLTPHFALSSSSSSFEEYTAGIYCYRNAGGSGRATVAPRLLFARSRSGTNGTIGGVVSNGDDIGNIRFAADDGSEFLTAAEILAEVDGTPGDLDMPGRLVFSTTADGASSPTERLRIASDGRATFANDVRMDGGTTSVPALLLTADNNAGKGLEIRNAGNSLNVEIGVDGSATFAGAVSKGSGSFRIDHPLKAETHQLVHSFVEGPQADNIYRGKVDLAAGTAAVNIDAVAGMTEGTFVALNREIQCFTTNETGWTAIKGSVTGNVLTITAQENTCTDTISWLVIGERQDQHMYDTNWTDENGKVIVEPEKPVAASEAE